MPAAGDAITVPTVPGSRVATVEQTSDSVGFTTTETVTMSGTFPLVTGRTYRVRHEGIYASSTSGVNDVMIRLREDTVAGTQMQQGIVTIKDTGFGWRIGFEVEYIALATGNKTFVATGVRHDPANTATYRLEAATNRPSYLYVDYIRG